MKKVALLHFAYPPSVGGVEIFIREQSLVLSDLGYDTLVLVGSGKENDKRVNLIEVKEFQSLSMTNRELYNKILSSKTIPEGFYETAKIIRERLEMYLLDRDVVIIHNMLSLTHNLPFIHACKDYVLTHPEKIFISWIHDHKFVGFDKVRTTDFILSPDVNKLLTEKINKVTYVTISKSLKELLIKVTNLAASDVHVISNGINIQKFLEIDNSIWELSQKYSLLQKFPLIITPANILDRKNIDYCLDVVSDLREYYPNVLYMITGNTSRHKDNESYYNLLKNKIVKLSLENHVLFLGTVYNRALLESEIHDLYSLSDIVFYLSKSENFGLPLLESALAKTPIFLSNLAVFKEIAGENFTYLDIDTLLPKDISRIVINYLEKSKSIAVNHYVKNNYELSIITREKLIPFFK